jgi:hypothetical protein
VSEQRSSGTDGAERDLHQLDGSACPLEFAEHELAIAALGTIHLAPDRDLAGPPSKRSGERVQVGALGD